jgi:transcriptional regulator with XRE-family HTH domain
MDKKLSEQIRVAIKSSGMTRYRLCCESGVDQGALSRFVHGKAGLSLDALDRIGLVLGLQIVIRPMKRQRGK